MEVEIPAKYRVPGWQQSWLVQGNLVDGKIPVLTLILLLTERTFYVVSYLLEYPSPEHGHL